MNAPRLLAVLVALAVIAGGMTPALAGTFRLKLSVDVDKDKDKEKVSGGKYGAGMKNTNTIFFIGTLDNRGFDDLEDVQVLFYVFGEPYDWDGETDLYLTKKLKPELLTLKRAQRLEFNIGDAAFENQVSATPGTVWKGGMKYYGWAAEVYVGDELALTEASSSKMEKEFKKLQASGKLGKKGKK